MRTLIVYESQFGNTAELARAIAASLEALGPTELCDVRQQTFDYQGVGLLVVGGPTQGHGVSKALVAALEHMPSDSLNGVWAAAFDTRVKWPKWLSGSAADGIARQLERKGARLAAPPATFLVEGKEGPLAKGEVERAQEWTRVIARALPVGATL